MVNFYRIILRMGVVMGKDFFAVGSGGLLGGFFWIVTQVIGANSFDLPLSIYLYGLLGGFFAAGVAVYLPGDTDLTQVKRVFFVAAVAGISFPSVIGTALTAEDLAQLRSQTAKVEETTDAVEIALTENPLSVADRLSEAALVVNSGVVKPEAKVRFESTSMAALDQLTDQAETASDPEQLVKTIDRIGTLSPELQSQSAARLATLANSENQATSRAATDAVQARVKALPSSVRNAYRKADAEAEEAVPDE